jgi:hypothetical protein
VKRGGAERKGKEGGKRDSAEGVKRGGAEREGREGLREEIR